MAPRIARPAISWLPRESLSPRSTLPSWAAPRTVHGVPSRAPRACAPGSLPPPERLEAPVAEPPPLTIVVAPPAAPEPPPSVHPAVVEAQRLAVENAALRDEHVLLRGRVAQLEAELSSLRIRVLRESEAELLRLALTVAERIVGRELRVDPTLAAAWARDAVDALDARDELTVALAPDLAERVPAEAWAQALATPHALVVDPALEPGALEVRAGAAVIDASPAGRLAALRAELGGESE